MNQINSLPRQIESIIQENLPKALKTYEKSREKKQSLVTLNKHKESNTVPRSIMVNTKLIIPDILSSTPEDTAIANQATTDFNQAIIAFQRAALEQMIVVNTRAAILLEQKLLTFLETVDKEIIEFHFRLLQLTDPDKLDSFLAFKNAYPNRPLADSDRIQECQNHIQEWRRRYQAVLISKLAVEVEASIARDKKLETRQAAEDVIMDDVNNDLIRDLIRKELAPIKRSMKRLNTVQGEKENSSRDPKNSKPQSRASAKPPKAPEVAKDAKNASSNKQKNDGKKQRNGKFQGKQNRK